ncbi:MAG: hypothetical protein ACPGYV_00355 [Phycisphaeraceae bacterium]
MRADEVNGPRVWSALIEFGAPIDDFEPEEWQKPGVGMHIGLPPGRIDILTVISGVTFDQAWADRLTGQCLGIDVDVIGLDAMIENKRASGREKDLIDLIRLEQRRRDQQH